MTEPIRPEDMRVSDIDRDVVQERLRQAQGVGQLDIHEFDERVQAVWSARTRGELERVVADLPAPPPPAPRTPARRVFTDTPGGMTMRVLTIIWAAALVVNLVVWGLVSVTALEAIYPWWIWMGPPGAVLAVLYAAGIGRPPRT